MASSATAIGSASHSAPRGSEGPRAAQSRVGAPSAFAAALDEQERAPRAERDGRLSRSRLPRRPAAGEALEAAALPPAGRTARDAPEKDPVADKDRPQNAAADDSGAPVPAPADGADGAAVPAGQPGAAPADAAGQTAAAGPGPGDAPGAADAPAAAIEAAGAAPAVAKPQDEPSASSPVPSEPAPGTPAPADSAAAAPAGEARRARGAGEDANAAARQEKAAKPQGEAPAEARAAADAAQAGPTQPAQGQPAQSQPAAQGLAPADMPPPPPPASAQGGAGPLALVGDVAQKVAVQTAAAGAAVPVHALAVTIAARASTGSTRFDIRLDPPELGRIEVQMTLDREGRVRSKLVVEKRETLELLQRDQRNLERTLQQAGLDTPEGGIEFSLRDQSGRGTQGGEDQPSHRRHAAADPEAPAAAPAGPVTYTRLAAIRGGIDIRI